MLALGKTLSNNIAALKEAKGANEAETQKSNGGGVKNCAEFIALVKQRQFAKEIFVY